MALPQPVQLRARDNVEDEEVCFEKVWAGEAHFLALACDGRLFSWGSGRFGQLGHGTVQADVVHPTPIEALEGLRVVDAACGATHSLALSDIGDVYAFGLNNYGQLGIGTGGDTTLPPAHQQQPTTITNNNQYSNGARTDQVNTALPQLVDFYNLERSTSEPIDINIVKIACGNAHSAIKVISTPAAGTSMAS
ncbi:hypothetical protein DFQ26_008362 [Actinomortierella ambigua]|nr:hypothetical protein DFQ26_008362 [Actinomortierella ambigua]